MREYIDRGISGAKGRDQRPQFNAILNGVARKDFDLVGCGHRSRNGPQDGEGVAHAATQLSRIQRRIKWFPRSPPTRFLLPRQSEASEC